MFLAKSACKRTFSASSLVIREKRGRAFRRLLTMEPLAARLRKRKQKVTGERRSRLKS
jgi:hypothetical protein